MPAGSLPLPERKIGFPLPIGRDVRLIEAAGRWVVHRHSTSLTTFQCLDYPNSFVIFNPVETWQDARYLIRVNV